MEARQEKTKQPIVMKRTIALFAATILFAGVFTPIETIAAEKKAATKEKVSSKKKRDTYPYYGTIDSIKDNVITIKGKTKNRVITVSDSAKITRNGQPAKLADIKAGAYVTGSVKKVDGKEIAVTVYEKPKPEPKSKKK